MVQEIQPQTQRDSPITTMNPAIITILALSLAWMIYRHYKNSNSWCETVNRWSLADRTNKASIKRLTDANKELTKLLAPTHPKFFTDSDSFNKLADSLTDHVNLIKSSSPQDQSRILRSAGILMKGMLGHYKLEWNSGSSSWRPAKIEVPTSKES